MKNFFNTLLDRIVTNFGFDSCADFSGSFLHINLMTLTLPIAFLSAFIQNYFGLHAITLVSFILLITLELITGIRASRMRGIPLQSKKFSRFGFKLGIWVTLFFILNSMYLQYQNNSVLGSIYSWLHGSIFIYVTLEYMLSVLENISVITGDSNNYLLRVLKGSIGKYLKNKDGDLEDFFQIKEELLAVLTPEGNFKKVNKAWCEALGYDDKYILTKSFKDFAHSDDASSAKKEFNKLKTTGLIKDYKMRYKTKEGSFLYLTWDIKSGKNGLFYCTTKILS